MRSTPLSLLPLATVRRARRTAVRRAHVGVSHAALIAVFVACSGSTAPSSAPTTSGTESSAAARPRSASPSPAAARCEAQNTYPAFRGCPHWRMAGEAACGADVQPQEMNPCQCMCDLCTTDSDCGGGRCVAISSVMLGGHEQKACVQPGGPCFPDGSCANGQVCRNYDGHPRCEAPTRR
jgi:hypothetical protein